MATEPRSHSEYTVGWVCALPKEQTAATAMLDDIHPDLHKPANDNNTYTLGSIGKHKIVIACLPKGEYGTNAAAMVATRMVSTFPCIKVGLMVGTGGGIPPKVQLGDVVVSVPSDKYPGVVQWDFGKAEKDGKFRRTGALNKPPRALLTALTKLETRHEMQGSKINHYLDDLKDKWPSMAAKYSRPGPYNVPVSVPEDGRRYPNILRNTFSTFGETILVLFWYFLGLMGLVPTSEEFKVTRGGIITSSNTSTGMNKEKPRDIRVHYGLIASGNKVIKDAQLRDALNDSLGGKLLCVEMEAAGLMDQFPCIVIRGICDYADSQKNKDWQNYAAVVAAAYAKELLEHVQSSDISGERPVKDILDKNFQSL
ncbi:nucleoside phosphorylase domain-containing protein [Hypomontagnella monticulosa]|nr:nucleoside phosphorylase domain-containing protein [Hypomontagnella monticulosa]